MSYQPFLIAPFTTGLKVDQTPWLLPQDAFTSIVNGHIHDGVLEKRSGYIKQADMVHGVVLTAASNANPAVFTVTSITGISNGDTVQLNYLSGGTWNNLNGFQYTVSNIVGATFNLTDLSGSIINGGALGAYTASSGYVGYYPKYRMMGIFRFISAQNERQTLIADTKRVAIYNANDLLYSPLSVYDTTGVPYAPVAFDAFASTKYDYIWAANWDTSSTKNRVYFTNGKEFTGATPGTDGILFYDDLGPYVQQFQPVINATGTEILYGCKLLFTLKNRLLAFHTFENDSGTGITTTFPQRLRWCAFQNPSNWDSVTPGSGGFSDAPTGDQIVSAQLLQNYIIVQFTDSVWSISPTSDPALPFRWDRVNSFRACDGKMATVARDRFIVAAGERGITATDATQTQRVDSNIKIFVQDEINDNEFKTVFFQRDYNFRRTWMLYPKIESSDANAALIYDEDSNSYSTYEFTIEDTENGLADAIVDLNVLGYGQSSIDYTAPDIIASNGYAMPDDDLNPDNDADSTIFDTETALSFSFGDNAELFLAGNRAGTIYIITDTANDNGNPISFSLSSAGWNPFKDQSQPCQMGYVDLYIDSDINTLVNIEFFTDDNETPYASQSIDCLPNLYYLSSITDVVFTDPLDPTQGFTISAPNHGLSDDQEIFMYGIIGIPNICNQSFIITLVDVNTFTIDIDATAFSFVVYVNGGRIYRNRFYRTKCWKRVYSGGTGYLHYIDISSTGSNTPLKIYAFKPWFRQRGLRILG